MAKLPTIKLRNRATGLVVKLNQTDYARDIAKWDGWTVVYVQRGNATDEEVNFSAAQSDIEKFRRKDPARQAWSRDDERAYNERKVAAGGIAVKPTLITPHGKPLV
jgi:hypothetical protein